MESTVNVPPCDPISAHSYNDCLYFRLLHAWLQDCDNNHNDCKLQQGKDRFWPTRVIFIGELDKITLIEKRFQDQHYIALSHCWGNLTEKDKSQICTTPKNYHNRLQGFNYNDLPKTFQHAIQVTRELGKQYLWIDALCIIQGHDGDWESEAKTMENIFANAYCTIAASSAGNWANGFLRTSSDSEHTKILSNAEGLTCTCDFEEDIYKEPLMKRAWVLQERVLSRRIIHFTASHTYWECGDRVRCENFTTQEP